MDLNFTLLWMLSFFMQGVVAVSCTEAISHAERVAKAGRPANAYILVWNFKDPIHPEYVLQVNMML